MNTDHAIVEEKGHIMVITLNRPEKRNALSPGMLVTIYEAWRKLDEDPNLRCAVLTGFCKARMSELQENLLFLVYQNLCEGYFHLEVLPFA